MATMSQLRKISKAMIGNCSVQTTVSFFLGAFFGHISSFSCSLTLALNYSEYDSLQILREICKIQYVFVTLFFVLQHIF